MPWSWGFASKRSRLKLLHGGKSSISHKTDRRGKPIRSLVLGRDQHNLKSNILALSISNPYRSCGAVSRDAAQRPQRPLRSQSHSAAWIESPTVRRATVEAPIQVLSRVRARLAASLRPSSGQRTPTSRSLRTYGGHGRAPRALRAGGTNWRCRSHSPLPRFGGDHSAPGLEDLGLATHYSDNRPYRYSCERHGR